MNTHRELLHSIPKSEKVWQLNYNEQDELLSVITSNNTRTIYYLYERDGNKLIKSKNKGKSPLDFRKEEIV